MVGAMRERIDQLITIGRAYAAAEGIELSAVSWRVFGDSKKLGAIVAGADIYSTRLEAAMAWFSNHWPARTAWPKGVPRPRPAPDASRAGADPEAAA